MRSHVYNSFWEKNKYYNYPRFVIVVEHTEKSTFIVSQRIHWIQVRRIFHEWKFILDTAGMTADDCSTPPSNQRGGGQASGDYRDKFDLKISYRRGWKIGMDPELSSVSRMYSEFDGSFL